MSYEIIPIRPHFKKMIGRTKNINPFTISIHKCLYSDIICQPILGNGTLNRLSGKKNLTDELVIIIPESLYNEQFEQLIIRDYDYIDSLLSVVFRKEMFIYLDENCFEKGDIKHYIEKFIDYSKISEDDIPFETLIKKYYRYRKRFKKKLDVDFRSKKQNQKQIITEKNGQIRLFL